MKVTDEDGVDGPFDRAIGKAIREDSARLRKLPDPQPLKWSENAKPTVEECATRLLPLLLIWRNEGLPGLSERDRGDASDLIFDLDMAAFRERK